MKNNQKRATVVLAALLTLTAALHAQQPVPNIAIIAQKATTVVDQADTFLTTSIEGERGVLAMARTQGHFNYGPIIAEIGRVVNELQTTGGPLSKAMRMNEQLLLRYASLENSVAELINLLSYYKTMFEDRIAAAAH